MLSFSLLLALVAEVMLLLTWLTPGTMSISLHEYHLLRYGAFTAGGLGLIGLALELRKEDVTRGTVFLLSALCLIPSIHTLVGNRALELATITRHGRAEGGYLAEHLERYPDTDPKRVVQLLLLQTRDYDDPEHALQSFISRARGKTRRYLKPLLKARVQQIAKLPQKKRLRRSIELLRHVSKPGNGAEKQVGFVVRQILANLQGVSSPDDRVRGYSALINALWYQRRSGDPASWLKTEKAILEDISKLPLQQQITVMRKLSRDLATALHERVALERFRVGLLQRATALRLRTITATELARLPAGVRALVNWSKTSGRSLVGATLNLRSVPIGDASGATTLLDSCGFKPAIQILGLGLTKGSPQLTLTASISMAREVRRFLLRRESGNVKDMVNRIARESITGKREGRPVSLTIPRYSAIVQLRNNASKQLLYNHSVVLPASTYQSFSKPLSMTLRAFEKSLALTIRTKLCSRIKAQFAASSLW